MSNGSAFSSPSRVSRSEAAGDMSGAGLTPLNVPIVLNGEMGGASSLSDDIASKLSVFAGEP